MNNDEDYEKVFEEFWREWHQGVDEDLVPIVNTSFKKGFMAGIEHMRRKNEHS